MLCHMRRQASRCRGVGCADEWRHVTDLRHEGWWKYHESHLYFTSLRLCVLLAPSGCRSPSLYVIGCLSSSSIVFRGFFWLNGVRTASGFTRFRSFADGCIASPASVMRTIWGRANDVDGGEFLQIQHADVANG